LYIPSKKIAVLGTLATLFIFMIWTIYSSVEYTSSLQERPFIAGLVGQVTTLDPAKVDGHEEKLAASALYEGLVYYDDRSGIIKPNLAQEWKYSANGRELTIKLKRDIYFHNGKKMSAADVKNSWEKSLSAAKSPDKINLLLAIDGAKEMYNGYTQTIAGIKVVDQDTLSVTLVKPNAAFIYSLTNPVFWIRDIEDRSEVRPGTGPFMFKEFKNNNLLLTRNDKYHRGRPSLTELHFIMYRDAYAAFADYKARKLDYLDKVPLDEVKNILNNKEYRGLYVLQPIQSIYALGFNLNKEPFADNYLLRRALNYAVDRKALIDNITGGLGIPLKGALPVGLPGYDKEMRGYSFNPEQAMDLLDQAGYPDGEGLHPVELIYNESPGQRRLAEAVAAQLDQLGIPVKLKGLPWPEYVKRLTAGNGACFRLGWEADYPDSDAFLYPLFHSSCVGRGNFTGYNNSQVDRILDTSRAETISHKERIKLLRRAEKIIIDDAPMLWVYQQEVLKMIGRDVGGFELDPMEMVNWFKLELKQPLVDESPPSRRSQSS